MVSQHVVLLLPLNAEDHPLVHLVETLIQHGVEGVLIYPQSAGQDGNAQSLHQRRDHLQEARIEKFIGSGVGVGAVADCRDDVAHPVKGVNVELLESHGTLTIDYLLVDSSLVAGKVSLCNEQPCLVGTVLVKPVVLLKVCGAKLDPEAGENVDGEEDFNHA